LHFIVVGTIILGFFIMKLLRSLLLLPYCSSSRVGSSPSLLLGISHRRVEDLPGTAAPVGLHHDPLGATISAL
jgi:hypothetical protein